MKIFFVGAKPWTANQISAPTMISINALHDYKNVNAVCSLIDSGAFTSVSCFGGYPKDSLPKYAKQILKFNNERILGFVAQDYMCEQFILEKTKLTIKEHQRFTIYRYKALRKIVPNNIYLMPVLQGYEPSEYLEHLRMYGDLLPFGAWCGVGSVCKRNSKPLSVIEVLKTIKSERPDLKLHGFGLKKTALQNAQIRDLLFSSDSFAWSFDSFHKKKNNDSSDLAANYSHEIYSLITA